MHLILATLRKKPLHCLSTWFLVCVLEIALSIALLNHIVGVIGFRIILFPNCISSFTISQYFIHVSRWQCQFGIVETPHVTLGNAVLGLVSLFYRSA